MRSLGSARAALLAGVTLLPVGPGLSADPQATPKESHVAVETLPLSVGRRDRHRVFDVDGDGRQDLVVVSRLTTPLWPFATAAGLHPFPPRAHRTMLRCIEVFWNGAGGFRKETTLFLVPPGARCFTLADVLPERGVEIVLADAEGLVAASPAELGPGGFGDGAFRRVATAPSYFDFADPEQLPEWTAVVRGRGTEGDAIVLPQPDGFRLWRAAPGDGAGLSPGEELRFFPRSETESSTNRFFGATKRLPRPLLRDLDGDGDVDLFVTDPSGAPQLIAYMGRPGGRFAGEPVVRGAPSLRRELRSDVLTFETADAVDLNADGVCDLVVSHTEGNIGLWETLTTSQLVYFGRKGSAGFDTTPDQVVSSVGISIVPRAIDFDGDGLLDLQVSSYRTDLLSNVRNAILNSARITYFLFVMDGGRFPQNATVERSIEIDFKVLEKGGIEPRAYFSGDFDGDGVKDLLAVEEESLTKAFRGSVRAATLLTRAGYDFDKSPFMSIALRATNDLEISDLDGDRRSEIVFPEPRLISIARYAP